MPLVFLPKTFEAIPFTDGSARAWGSVESGSRAGAMNHMQGPWVEGGNPVLS